MWTSENNWYKWSYGNNEPFGRQSEELLEFRTSYACKFNLPVLSFKEELLNAARSTLDHYPGIRPCVFFSGGVDSELMLRAYLDIKSNPLVYIIRYENDINIYDVSYAVTVCSLLNVDYKIIDFNLSKFYENDAELVSEQSQIDRPRMLPHLKFTECADGLIIVGHSDMAWARPHADYSKSVDWVCYDYEHDIGCDKYNLLHNRSAVYQWWKWTPGLIISYTKLKWFQELINDKYPGKLGINSTKLTGFKEAYPDLLERKKYTGFEQIEPLIQEVEKFFIKKYNGLPYRGFHDRTLDQLYHEIAS